MMGYRLDTIRGLFFDRRAVRASVDRATRRVLSRFGAYVRVTAKSSIRKRKGVSPPGRPPSSHTGLLKRFIYFGYDADRQSVVIGPVRLPSKTGDAPPLLEYGGRVRVRQGQWMRRGRPGRDARGRFTNAPRVFVKAGTTLRYAARPFMGPAMQQELPGLPAMWADSIR